MAVTFPNAAHPCLYSCNKRNITIINVSVFFGNSGELIKNAARCCQPQVWAWRLVRCQWLSMENVPPHESAASQKARLPPWDKLHCTTSCFCEGQIQKQQRPPPSRTWVRLVSTSFPMFSKESCQPVHGNARRSTLKTAWGRLVLFCCLSRRHLPCEPWWVLPDS